MSFNENDIPELMKVLKPINKCFKEHRCCIKTKYRIKDIRKGIKHHYNLLSAQNKDINDKLEKILNFIDHHVHESSSTSEDEEKELPVKEDDKQKST